MGENVITSMVSRKAVAPVMGCLLMLVAQSASAISLDYFQASNNAGIDLSSQFETTLTAVSGGVEFTFFNHVGVDSSITDIYFDLGTNNSLFSNFSIAEQSAGVSFDLTPHPGNLPAPSSFNFTSDFGGDSTSPHTAANGIDVNGEYLTFLGTLGAGFTYADLLADILDDTFRVGLHVQSIGQAGESDAYISRPNVIPLPAAAWLFGSALTGLFISTRRRKAS